MSLLVRLLARGAASVHTPAQSNAHNPDTGGLTQHGRSMRTAWQSFTRLLADYHWYILAVAGGVAFVLGCIGWWRILNPGQHPIPSDGAFVAYWSFKDFFMNAPSERNIPWELDVARFLAPVVAGWAGLSALGLLFRDRSQQMKIPWMRGHVVICGLGDFVGIMFVRHLRDKRTKVVVIEFDAANPNIELCRSLGVPVIVGDAQRLRTLQAAGAQRASRVLAVTADDAVNTQIVATWRELPGRRSRRLGCLAQISDPEFCKLLRIQEAERGDPELSVDFFNIDEISARLMLKKFPPDFDQPHIVVAHLDPLGVWLAYHAARAWYVKRGDKTAKLVVTILDDDAEERRAALLGQYPALEKVCTFVTTFSTSAKDIEQLLHHHRDSATPPISRAYVTAYHDQQAFETALTLHHELQGLDPAVPVVVALTRPHGVAALLGDVKQAGALVNVDVFSTMEQTCTVDLVRGGSFEPIAEDIHKRWRQEQLAEGKPAPLWEDLDESRRESSRAQARHIAVKLHMIGCAATPLRRWDATDFSFTDEEVEKLAIAEHDRWWDERLADGWTLIDLKDMGDPEEAKRRKQSPYLVPFKDLPPKIAEYDRIFVREIPRRLASVGLQVIRTRTTAVPGTEQTSPP
jgi:voltage-gated potassium channel Kch